MQILFTIYAIGALWVLVGSIITSLAEAGGIYRIKWFLMDLIVSIFWLPLFIYLFIDESLFEHDVY
jgi:hypothetical protein